MKLSRRNSRRKIRIMMSPRADQIGELTQGLRLPMPPIPSVHLNVIVDAIRRALEQLVKKHGRTLAGKEENELNALLQARMNAICAKEKPLSQMVSCVVRGGESVSFNGTRLELRPDIGIHLTGRNRNFPLLVECKIIDTPNKKGVDLYCTNGLRRFVEGDYAWASSQGLMLAYVRDGSSVVGALTPHLTRNAASRPDPFQTQTMPQEIRVASWPFWISCHGRGFTYIGGAKSRPTPIDISHLWFDMRGGVISKHPVRSKTGLTRSSGAE